MSHLRIKWSDVAAERYPWKVSMSFIMDWTITDKWTIFMMSTGPLFNTNRLLVPSVLIVG
jgi:hypothetical protein